MVEKWRVRVKPVCPHVVLMNKILYFRSTLFPSMQCIPLHTRVLLVHMICIHAMHGWRKIIQKQANKPQAHCSGELGGDSQMKVSSCFSHAD